MLFPDREDSDWEETGSRGERSDGREESGVQVGRENERVGNGWKEVRMIEVESAMLSSLRTSTVLTFVPRVLQDAGHWAKGGAMEADEWPEVKKT